MADNETERIARRIRAILALAHDSAAADAEIRTAMGIAQRMMDAHHLSRDDVDGAAPQQEQMGTENVDTLGAACSSWEGWLAQACCKVVGGVLCYRHGKSPKRDANGIVERNSRGNLRYVAGFCIFGVAEDCRLAADLFRETAVIIAATARLKWGGVLRGPGRCYAEGFARVLLEESKSRSAERTERTTAIVIDRERKATQWLAKAKGIHLQTQRRSVTHANYNGDAYRSGRADGAAYGLRPGQRKLTS